MSDNLFAPDDYLAAYYEHALARPFADVKTAGEARQAGAAVRQALRGLLALDSIPGRVESLKPLTLKKTRCKGYTQQRLSVELCEGWHMPVWLLTPEKPNGAGVVALCGHGYGARQILRLSGNGRRRAVNFLDNYQKNFAVELAKRGCTVAVPELIGFGEARLKKDSRKPFYASSCYGVTSALHLCGGSTAALRVYQAVRCLDLLEVLGSVDPERLGCMGISGGGLVSLFTACIDERVNSAVVSGYVNTLRGSVLSRWHCADNYVHGLLSVGDIHDLASAIAPRRLCVESGRADRLFPIGPAEEAHREIGRVYSLMGAGDNLVIDVFDGRHRISGKHAFDFFEA